MTSDIASTPIAAPGPHHKSARTALIAFLLLATMVWIGIAIGANTRAPGVVGLAATIFGGLFAALLTATIGGWIALKLADPDAGSPRAASLALSDPTLAPALLELDRLQRPIVRSRIDRAAWRTPVGASIGVALWSAIVLTGALGGVVDFMAAVLIGGLAGYVWAQRDAGREAGSAYLGKPIEVLAADSGGFVWRNTASVDAARLRALGVLRSAATVVAGGELAGRHGDAQVRILPIDASPPPGDSAAGFAGLLIEIEALGVDKESMEQLAQMRPGAVALIDQLATLPGLGKPTCAMSGGRLTLTLPETAKPRLFDPPSSISLDAAAPRLARIRLVIESVTQVADALSRQD